MFAMLAPLFAGSVAATGIMSATAAKIALTAGGALIDTAMAKNKQKSANAAQQAAYEKQLAQDEQNRLLAKDDASNKFTDMSAAARKAGFNPLTVLRTTGGAGFGSYGGYTAIAPVLSKFNFAQTFAQTAAKSFYDQKINEPIDKYNKEIRDLELAQRKADLKMSKATYGALSKDQIKQPTSLPLYGVGGKPITTTGGAQVFVAPEAQEAIPMYVPVYDQATGQVFATFNPDLLESGPGEAATGLAMMEAAKRAADSGQPIKTPLGTFDTDPIDLSFGQLSRGMPIALPATSF